MGTRISILQEESEEDLLHDNENILNTSGPTHLKMVKMIK